MHFSQNKTPAGRLSLRASRICAASAAIVLGVTGSAYAETGQTNAKLAIVRAQANLDLVSRENPAATQDQTYTAAQQKLADARIAVTHSDLRRAEWLANESELLAETTAASAKLASLEHTRGEVAHDVQVLDSEINKSEQRKE